LVLLAVVSWNPWSFCFPNFSSFIFTSFMGSNLVLCS
jgi:hypothetical protein